MHDRPTAAELLEIVAETLSDTVVPATEPHARHQARVAANLCRVIARELNQAHAPESLLASIEADLGVAQAASTNDRLANIARAIGSLGDDAVAPVHEQVAALVKSKLDVAKPDYYVHDAVAEAGVVS